MKKRLQLKKKPNKWSDLESPINQLVIAISHRNSNSAQLAVDNIQARLNAIEREEFLNSFK